MSISHTTRPGRSCLVKSVLLVLLMSLVPLARAEKHEFVYDVSHEANKPQNVHLAGDFNGWSKDATPMQRDGDIFKATIDLTEGVHHYKFVVNGDKWVNDPKHSDKELEVDDNYGGKNSAVMIGPDIRKAPPVKPNDIHTDLLSHNPAEDCDNAGSGRLRLRVRLCGGAIVHAVRQKQR